LKGGSFDVLVRERKVPQVWLHEVDGDTEPLMGEDSDPPW